MKKWLTTICLLWQIWGWSNSINLFNNTEIRLKAVILAADGSVLDEVILDTRDASTWSDNFDQFGYDPSATKTPYTVHWYCMGGKLFGTCKNVSSGSVVLAQNCAISQGCYEDDDDEDMDE